MLLTQLSLFLAFFPPILLLTRSRGLLSLWGTTYLKDLDLVSFHSLYFVCYLAIFAHLDLKISISSH